MSVGKNDRTKIITALDSIGGEDLRKYLVENLSNFPKGTVFSLFTVHHHKKVEDDRVVIGKSDSKLVSAYNDMIESFEKECEKNCKDCDQCKLVQAWNLGKYSCSVKPLSTEEKNGKYELRINAKKSLQNEFDNISRSDVPNTIIFASCYSDFSEIKTIMQSCGFISSVAVSSERGDITKGKYYVCDPEQRDLFTTNDVEGNSGHPALHLTSEKGHLDIYRHLLSKGCDVNAMDDRKWTSLHAASLQGHLEVAEDLIAKGATIDAKEIDGFTPLILAAQEGHLKLVELLFSNKADINATTRSGTTALHLASNEGHLDICRYLIAEGCDVTIKSEFGDALGLAAKGGHQDIVDLLKQKM